MSTAAGTTTGLSGFRIPGGLSFQETHYVEIINQLELPHKIEWTKIDSIQGAFDAIRSMKIRGAPAIASLASLGLASELYQLLASCPSPSFPASTLTSPSSVLLSLILTQTSYLLTSRPTAVNLLEALTRIEKAGNKAVNEDQCSPKELAERVIQVAIKVWEDDNERNHRMGDFGAKWILEKLEGEGSIKAGEKIAVLTVCNTGSLATSGYGTALGVITSLHAMRRLSHAYYAQTGPYQQGARLTSMELASLGIDNTMVCDTAIGALIAEKRVHLFVAGADRVTANGDTANKISTYQISLLCSQPHPFSPNPPVPVLIACPIATLDLAMDSGRSIIIEQRPSWEACTVRGRVVNVTEMGKTGGLIQVGEGAGQVQVETVLITPPNTRAWNPAFDVTPASLISGIVTELGVASKTAGGEFDLRSFVKENQ